MDVNVFEESVKKFVAFRTLFATSAHQYMSEEMPTNSVISPFPAECSLTLMQLGAKGRTKEEIRAELGHLPCVDSSISMALHFVFTLLPLGTFHRLELATKIYVSQKYVIKQEFRHIVEDYCESEIENIDFTQQCANAMDQWVQNHTSNLFQKKIADHNMLTPTTKMVLVNGVDFKGRWKLPFSKKDTPMQFFVSEKESIEIESMTNKQLHKYYYFDELMIKILDIEFESQKEEASLVLIIPDAIEDLSLVEENITSVFNLNRQLFQQTVIELELPIFKIETIVDFKDIFNRSGIQMIFNEDEADLTGISDKKGLCLNNFIQKVVFDFNEEGINVDDSLPNSGGSFEDLTSPLPDSTDSDHLYVKVDRPFAFYIKVRNVIVLSGRFLNPIS